MNWLALATIVTLVPTASASMAATPTCDGLSGKRQALAMKLLASQHPHDCCDETIAKCLERTPTCRLAERLAENICRRVIADEDEAMITRALSRRARTMIGMDKLAKIDLSSAVPAGRADAPVTLVGYLCGRCPFCAKITPELHIAVTDGPLAGKAKLFMRVFPIRSHEHSREAGLGFLAAAQLGGFWQFVLHAYANFDRFCPLRQVVWAKDVGLDMRAFGQLLNDPALEELLITSKKEGIVNEVDATPTFFVNGRRYRADLSVEEIIDVVEEEYENHTGAVYSP